MPGHRITTTPENRRIRVSSNGEVLADSASAVLLQETGAPSRWYLPRDDVRATLVPSDNTSHCPFKGDAAYYSVRLADGTELSDVVWYYPEPKADVAAIADRVCFYNEKVSIEAH